MPIHQLFKKVNQKVVPGGENYLSRVPRSGLLSGVTISYGRSAGNMSIPKIVVAPILALESDAKSLLQIIDIEIIN